MSSSSLSSSLVDSLDEQASPVQLNAENAPQPRPTVLQRITSATSAFFSMHSGSLDVSSILDADDPLAESRAINMVPSDAFDEHDLVGAKHFHRTLSRYTLTSSEFSSETAPDAASADSSLADFHPDLGAAELQDGVPLAPLQRWRSTVVSAVLMINRKLGFWDDEFLAERTRIVVTLGQNYLFLLIGFTCALCIYWGSYFNRTEHYRNIKFGVFNADAQVGDLTPLLGEYVTGFFELAPVAAYGNFDVWNYTRIADLASQHGHLIDLEVRRQLHHQKYVAVFAVSENATYQMYSALAAGNTSFDPASELLSAYYETGSDYNAVANTVSFIVKTLMVSFDGQMAAGAWTPFWVSLLGLGNVTALMAENPLLFTSLPTFQLTDLLPVTEQVVQAPLQIGLIYLCIFTFFQFVYLAPIHMYVGLKLKGWPFVIFRILTGQGAYFVLSLAYVLLDTAFQVPYNKAFGNLGFLVIWAIAFLTMSLVGLLIEILVLLCVILKPAMIGVALLFVAVLNLAPTITPIYLCPTFYRYGYAMPVYNSYHLMQVAYFNSWKGHMGREIAILVAWIVVTICAMPFALKWVSIQMLKNRGGMLMPKK